KIIRAKGFNRKGKKLISGEAAAHVLFFVFILNLNNTKEVIMLRKLLLPLLFIAFLASTAFAQTGSITGTVTNEQGEPIPTANVLLVEISRGAATNLQGEYTIENV